MQVIAQTKNIRHSPYKMRVVAREVSNMSIQEAQKMLAMSNKKAAPYILKTLNSAVANAVNNFELSEQNLIIKDIQIGEGMSYRKPKFRARGRLNFTKSRFSHIRVALTAPDADKEEA